MGRKIRTRLDLLRPSRDQHVSSKQAQQKADHDKHAHPRAFHIGQNVMARNLRPGAPWLPGVVVERLGPLTYLVQVDNGQLWKRHVDHLRIRGDTPHVPQTTPTQESDWSIPKSTPQSTEPDTPINEPPIESDTNIHHYPQRERRAPDRFM